MLLFIDTANIDQIREAASWGILGGVTTNPSLAAKEIETIKNKSLHQHYIDICELIDGPVSLETADMTAEGMITQGRELATLADNVAVKIPMCEEGMKAVKVLSEEGIMVNVTLIFSANQALLAALAGATFVSPFVGRLDDAGNDGIAVLEEIVEIFDIYDFDTEVISASIRSTIHVTQSALAGAHIATVPFDILKKMFSHPLTDVGIKKFMDDYNKVKGYV